MTHNTPEISVIIPAYNEENRIGLTLARTLAYLKAQHPSSEILVVDDGSTDQTSSLVQDLIPSEPTVRYLRQHERRGKGGAVRRGVLESNGTYILYMDADLATPIEEIDKLLPYLHQGADIVIGSRGLPDSDIRKRQPRYRELMGRGFNVLVRALLLGGISDTQCGFKLFKKEAAQAIFEKQQLDSFAFDVEVLLLARKLGFKVQEVAVIWHHEENSKVSPSSDAARMFKDIVKLRLRLLKSNDFGSWF